MLVVPFTGTLLYGKYQMSGSNKPTDNSPGDMDVNAEAASSRTVSNIAEESHDNSVKRTVEIAAPISGEIVPLSEVPDPAFAEKQMGQGIAIKPSEGKVYAPFDGTVAHLIKSKHALILTDTNGIQILIHVGINTVSLKGEGFTAHVESGSSFTQGQLLLEFDQKRIEQAGLPIITPVIVPDGQEGVQVIKEYEGAAIQNNNPVLRVSFALKS
ncbi:PTS system glucose-specific EIICBA component [compost metagenome]